MPSRVAAVEIDGDVQDSYGRALRLIGGIDDLNTADRTVVVKLGVFSPKTGIHTKVDTVRAITGSFCRASRIFIAESDSYGGEALERLQIWNEICDDRIVPFSLSTDTDTVDATTADKKVTFSHILFKPNIFISTHVPRRCEDAGSDDMMNLGSIVKNLLGLVPDRKKSRFHNKIATALVDMYEAIGGIDLAVLDSTCTFLGRKRKRATIQTDFLSVGRDTISVEAVGCHIVGLDAGKNPILQEAARRGLGERDINKIKLLGSPIEKFRQKAVRSFRELFPKKNQKKEGWI